MTDVFASSLPTWADISQFLSEKWWIFLLIIVFVIWVIKTR